MRLKRFALGSVSVALVAKQLALAAWTYRGCYLDHVGNRTLSHYASVDNSAQTIEQCTSYCDANGFNYAGLEYGAECFCDYSLTPGAAQEPDTDCSMACAGNSSQACGNSDRLSVYYDGNTGPVTNPGPSGWSLLDCYADSSGSRTLRQSLGSSSSQTVAGCTSACGAAGYALAGVEYGGECWCDVAIQNAAPIASGCSVLCSGNRTEFCGGANRINVYQASSATTPSGPPAGWTALGCFTDDASNRTLPSGQEVVGDMTIERCLSGCAAAGFAYAGVEYAQECFCGNAVQGGGACAADQASCYQRCKGNTAETCGGPNRLNIYYSGGDQSVVACSAGSPSSSSSSPSPSSSVSSTTSSSTTPTVSTSTTTSLSSSSSSSTTTSATPTSTACPSFWTNVVADLAPQMRDSNGQCNNLARAAIRFAFHDAASYSSRTPTYAPATGGADGSLLLSATEIDRIDHDGLRDYHATLNQKFASYRASGYAISAADLIQVASAVGTLACPGGRVGRVLVGRTDTTQEAPDGLLPQAFGAGSDHDTLLALFVDKGFTARDLAALIGAHSTSIANFQTAHGIPAGTPQDSTPGSWDVSYYNQTYFPPSGIARFDSDVNLSSNTTSAVGRQFRSFVGAQGAWGASFASAWQTMSLLGIPRSVSSRFQDCTTVVFNAPYGS